MAIFMKHKGLGKKILFEILFIISPALLPFVILPTLQSIPKFPYVTILGSLASLVLIISVLSKVSDKALLVIRGTVIGLLYLFWLKGSQFSFEGFFWDNRYFALAVERFYHSFLPFSHEYKYIHFSLPPLYFFITGKVGSLIKLSLPLLLKYSGFLFVVYLPYLWGYGLKGIFNEKKWYAAFILSLLIPFKTYESWYGAIGTYSQKSWHFIGIYLIIIWYIWVRKKNPKFIKAGILAGIVFAFDYYPFIPIFLVILLEIAMEIIPNHGLNEALKRFFYYAKIALVVIGVNLVWIFPVIIDLVKNQWGTSYNDWFHVSGANILNVLGFFNNFDFLSVVFLAGFLNLFINISKSGDMKHLKTMFVSLVLFGLVIYVLSFVKFTFLFANYSLFLIHILSFSCVFILLHLGKKKSIPIVILLIICSISVLNQTEQNKNLWNYSITSSHRYRISDQFRKDNNLKDEIIFPYTNELFYGQNTYSFISSTITYSDIAASYEKRLDYVKSLESLMRNKKTQEFYTKLKHTPYGQINYLMLKKSKESNTLYFDLKIYLNDLKYPDKRGDKRDINFTFDAADFDNEFFTQIYNDKEFVVYRLR